MVGVLRSYLEPAPRTSSPALLGLLVTLILGGTAWSVVRYVEARESDLAAGPEIVPGGLPQRSGAASELRARGADAGEEPETPAAPPEVRATAPRATAPQAAGAHTAGPRPLAPHTSAMAPHSRSAEASTGKCVAALAGAGSGDCAGDAAPVLRPHATTLGESLTEEGAAEVAAERLSINALAETSAEIWFRGRTRPPARPAARGSRDTGARRGVLLEPVPSTGDAATSAGSASGAPASASSPAERTLFRPDRL